MLKVLSNLFANKHKEEVYGFDLKTHRYVKLTESNNTDTLSEFNLGEFDEWVSEFKIESPIIIHNHLYDNVEFSNEDIEAYNTIKSYLSYDIGFYVINLKLGILKNIKGEEWKIERAI